MVRDVELERPQGGRRLQFGQYLVDVAHSASEWLWLPAAAEALAREVGERFGGTRLDTRVSTLRTDPWTFRLDSPPRPSSDTSTPATDPSGGRP